MVLHSRRDQVQHRLRLDPNCEPQEMDRDGHLRLHDILFRRHGRDGNVSLLSMQASTVRLHILPLEDNQQLTDEQEELVSHNGR